MIQTSLFKNGTRQILERIKSENPDVGDYLKHFVQGNSEIVVLVTNGKLSMPVDAAQNQETMPNGVPKSWIDEIALSFEQSLDSIHISDQQQPRFWTSLLHRLKIPFNKSLKSF